MDAEAFEVGVGDALEERRLYVRRVVRTLRLAIEGAVQAAQVNQLDTTRDLVDIDGTQGNALVSNATVCGSTLVAGGDCYLVEGARQFVAGCRLEKLQQVRPAQPVRPTVLVVVVSDGLRPVVEHRQARLARRRVSARTYRRPNLKDAQVNG
ncbi:hypothetical protein ACWCV9_08605 [Streptomyces sp. NPDC001606]